MDDPRLDRLARALGAPATRRGALAALLGSGVAGRMLDPAAAACDHKHGKRKRHCRRRHHDHNNNGGGNGNGHGNGGGNGADDCTVCASGCPFATIQAAIDAATAGGTVTVCPGTYKENLTIGKSLTLAGSGNGVTLDGNKSGPVVIVQGSGPVAIQGVTITNGTGTPIGGGDSVPKGGGILNGGDVTLTDVIVQNNTAGAGGGIANGSNRKLTLDNTIVRQNNATSEDVSDPGGGFGGGGIWNVGTVVVGNGSVLSGNQAFDGGAILTFGDVTISGGSRVASNQASNNGGGLYSDGGAITVDGSTVASNTATKNGGGILNRPHGDSNATLAVQNNADIKKNKAQAGGGVYNEPNDLPDDSGSVTVTISDSSIDNNDASQLGDGVFNDGVSVALQTSTIFGNDAKQTGGGIFNTNEGVVTLDDQSAVADNTPNNCVGTNACGA